MHRTPAAEIFEAEWNRALSARRRTLTRYFLAAIVILSSVGETMAALAF